MVLGELQGHVDDVDVLIGSPPDGVGDVVGRHQWLVIVVPVDVGSWLDTRNR